MNRKRLLKSVIAVTCAVMVVILMTACSARSENTSSAADTVAESGEKAAPDRSDSVTGRIKSIDGDTVTIEPQHHHSDKGTPPDMKDGTLKDNRYESGSDGNSQDMQNKDSKGEKKSAVNGSGQKTLNDSGSDSDMKSSKRSSDSENSSRPEKKNSGTSSAKKTKKSSDSESLEQQTNGSDASADDSENSKKTDGGTESSSSGTKQKPDKTADGSSSDKGAKMDTDEKSDRTQNGSQAPGSGEQNPSNREKQSATPDMHGSEPGTQQNGTPPAVDGNNGQDDASRTITLDLSKAVFEDGSPVGSADELKEGDIIKVEFDENGNIISITIITSGSSQPDAPDIQSSPAAKGTGAQSGITGDVPDTNAA